MKNFREYFAVWCIGGVIYGLCEVVWRGFTHWTMLLIGGFCFLLLYFIGSRMSARPIWRQCLAGSAAITAVEFTSGCFVNLYLGLGVWDYSSLPFDLLGQICLPYSALWFLLSFPALSFAKGLSRLFAAEDRPENTDAPKTQST